MSNVQGEDLRLQKWRGKIWAGNLAFVVRDLSTKRFVCKYLKKIGELFLIFSGTLVTEWMVLGTPALHLYWEPVDKGRRKDQVLTASIWLSYFILKMQQNLRSYTFSGCYPSYPKDYLAIHICHICFSVLVARTLKDKQVIEGNDLHLSCQIRTSQVSL